MGARAFAVKAGWYIQIVDVEAAIALSIACVSVNRLIALIRKHVRIALITIPPKFNSHLAAQSKKIYLLAFTRLASSRDQNTQS